MQNGKEPSSQPFASIKLEYPDGTETEATIALSDPQAVLNWTAGVITAWDREYWWLFALDFLVKLERQVLPGHTNFTFDLAKLQIAIQTRIEEDDWPAPYRAKAIGLYFDQLLQLIKQTDPDKQHKLWQFLLNTQQSLQTGDWPDDLTYDETLQKLRKEIQQP